MAAPLGARGPLDIQDLESVFTDAIRAEGQDPQDPLVQLMTTHMLDVIGATSHAQNRVAAVLGDRAAKGYSPFDCDGSHAQTKTEALGGFEFQQALFARHPYASVPEENRAAMEQQVKGMWESTFRRQYSTQFSSGISSITLNKINFKACIIDQEGYLAVDPRNVSQLVDATFEGIVDLIRNYTDNAVHNRTAKMWELYTRAANREEWITGQQEIEKEDKRLSNTLVQEIRALTNQSKPTQLDRNLAVVDRLRQKITSSNFDLLKRADSIRDSLAQAILRADPSEIVVGHEKPLHEKMFDELMAEDENAAKKGKEKGKVKGKAQAKQKTPVHKKEKGELEPTASVKEEKKAAASAVVPSTILPPSSYRCLPRVTDWRKAVNDPQIVREFLYHGEPTYAKESDEYLNLMVMCHYLPNIYRLLEMPEYRGVYWFQQVNPEQNGNTIYSFFTEICPNHGERHFGTTTLCINANNSIYHCYCDVFKENQPYDFQSIRKKALQESREGWEGGEAGFELVGAPIPTLDAKGRWVIKVVSPLLSYRVLIHPLLSPTVQ